MEAVVRGCVLIEYQDIAESRTIAWQALTEDPPISIARMRLFMSFSISLLFQLVRRMPGACRRQDTFSSAGTRGCQSVISPLPCPVAMHAPYSLDRRLTFIAAIEIQSPRATNPSTRATTSTV